MILFFYFISIYIGESDGIQIVLTNVTIHGTSQFHIQKLR